MQNLFYQHCYSLFQSAVSLFVYYPSEPLAKMYKPRSFKQQFTVRLRVVPHFSSGIVERAKRERVKITSREKRRHAAPFLAWGDSHARSRFARSTIPEEKWGTTRSLVYGNPLHVFKKQMFNLVTTLFFFQSSGF